MPVLYRPLKLKVLKTDRIDHKMKAENKVTSLCVHKKNKRKKTIGVLHIHNILDGNIT